MFTATLLSWYHQNKRQLPWRGTQDPYKVWISEIILQQTRVEQGWNYYLKFMELFPTVADLAAAEEQTVLKAWEGLGYYSRARNLHLSAKYVMSELKGKFPTTYKEILKLKGVGVYTASAIASICFQEYEPVVDGNVYRFLSRFFKIATPINTPASLNEFRALAQHYIDQSSCPGDFNQALMEFGATLCTPAKPNCEFCPFVTKCEAFHEGTVDQFPVKPPKIKIRNRYFYFLYPADANYLLVHQRTNAKDVWRQLYQLPLLETETVLNDKLISKTFSSPQAACTHTVLHKLTHQHLHIHFVRIPSAQIPKPAGSVQITKGDFKEYPFPKPLKVFVEEFFAKFL